MKVRVQYTVDVGDDERRFINARYGKSGLASRNEVRDYFRDYGAVNGREVLNTDMYYTQLAEQEAAERE